MGITERKHCDIAIIGGGPAGYTAALYSGRAGYSAVVFEKSSPGGQMGVTSTIENYPGIESVAGFDLTEKMMKHSEVFGAEMKFENVTALRLGGREKVIVTSAGEYGASAVILAMGAKPRLLDIDGEREYTGRGVSYCATCDGMFFRGKTAVVVGGGDTAFEDAIYLSNICRKVIVVHRRDVFRASAASVRRAQTKDNIEFVCNCIPEKIVGDDARVTGIVINNTINKSKSTIECDAVFVAIGRVPETELLDGTVETDKIGYIVADETCVTSLPGVFAAGDVRTKPLRQIVTACADGATAVKYAVEWLEEGKK